MNKKVNTVINKIDAEKKASDLLNQMTLDEKIKLIGGTRGFYIQAIERLGIKELFMSDGTCGIHTREDWLEQPMDFPIKKTTAFPAMIALASTWNLDRVDEYAASIAEECRAGDIAFLLGPGMNIYRHSQCGRNFEYAGEDPYLISRIIENYVVAVQEKGVAATIKHFVANNTDFYRTRSNSIVSERALNEIYFPAFQAGIDAGAVAVMTAYNLIDGVWASENHDMITNQLREKMGFEWLVMSDWWAIRNPVTAMKSGLDLEMPALEILENVKKLIEEGEVSVSDLDRMVLSILKTSIAMDLYNKDYQDKALLDKLPEHEKAALRTAQESFVLLKNHNNILPLKNEKKILLTGKFISKNAMGLGAAEVIGYNNRTILEVFEEEYGDIIEYIESPSDDDIKSADKIILSVGTTDSEASDRLFNLPDEDETEIKRILNLNSNSIVVVNSGGGINMSGWQSKAAAIIYCWYGGQTGSRALLDIITGRVNPSGKLPITIEKDFKDSPGYGYLPEAAELYTGWPDEKQHPIYDVNYTEGIFVGYRWYDKKEIAPLYPFGYGLSYTNFDYSELTISKSSIKRDDKIEIVFSVKNSGKVAGFETAQLYLMPKDSNVVRSIKELKGFSKLYLSPGEQKKVKLSLSSSDFQYWDENIKDWKLENCHFTVAIGASSEDIRLSKDIIVE